MTASRPARPGGDGGQVTTALLVLMVLAVLAVVLKALVPLVAATDQRSRAQTAADAAALAAVDLFADRTRKALEPGKGLGYAGRSLNAFFTCPAGRQEAQDYAGRNGATLIDGEWSCGRRGPGTDVRVQVRSDDRLEGAQRSEARARAALGLSPDPCLLSDDPAALSAAYRAAQAAAAAAAAADAAADNAAEKAAKAAEKAQDAADKAVEKVASGNLDPEVARDLIEAAQDAAEAARDALKDAAANAPGPAPVSRAALGADCGPFSLTLTLDLQGGGLVLDAVVGELDDALEPRLVSEGRADDV